MITELIQQAVPFLGTVGITVLEAGAGQGRATIGNAPGVRNHLGTLHAAAVFGVAETASGAAVVSVLADRLLPDGDSRAVRAVVSDADINYWRPVRGTVVASARLSEVPPESLTADELIRRRNVSVTVDLADGDDQAVGVAGFHWIITEEGPL